uniref:Uncharacterized protein n=1 Tax=Setaria italica TaxID=4555 RepID=K3XUD0_SETIT
MGVRYALDFSSRDGIVHRFFLGAATSAVVAREIYYFHFC